MEYYTATYGPDLYNAGWHFHVYPEIVPQTWPDPQDPEAGCNTWDAPPPGHGWWERPKRLNFENWHSDALAMLTFVWKWGEPDDAIWITEMGCLIPHCDTWDGFKYEYVSAFMGWLNNEGRWVDRYAWYTDVNDEYPQSSLYWPIIPTPTPTPTNYPYIYTALGNYYAHVSQYAVAASEPLPWPNSFIYFPVLHKD